MSSIGMISISTIHKEMVYLSRTDFLYMRIWQLSLRNYDATLTRRAESRGTASLYGHKFSTHRYRLHVLDCSTTLKVSQDYVLKLPVALLNFQELN